MWSLDSRLLLLMQISQESKLGPLYRLCLSTVKYAPEVVVEAKMLEKKKKKKDSLSNLLQFQKLGSNQYPIPGSERSCQEKQELI